MLINNADMEKKYKEEFARQVLLYFYHDRYKDSYLSDRPDIKNKVLSIGTEVTGSLNESINRKLSISRELAAKTKLESRDRTRLEQNEMVTKKTSDNRYMLGFYFWGDSNNMIRSYEKKSKNMVKEGYSIYKENNLYIDSRLADRIEVDRFLDYLKVVDTSREVYFDNIYIYTDIAYGQFILLTINTSSMTLRRNILPREDMAQIVERTRKFIEENLG